MKYDFQTHTEENYIIILDPCITVGLNVNQTIKKRRNLSLLLIKLLFICIFVLFFHNKDKIKKIYIVIINIVIIIKKIIEKSCLVSLLWNLQKNVTRFFFKSTLQTLLPSSGCSGIIFCPIPTSHIAFLRYLICLFQLILWALFTYLMKVHTIFNCYVYATFFPHKVSYTLRWPDVPLPGDTFCTGFLNCLKLSSIVQNVFPGSGTSGHLCILKVLVGLKFFQDLFFLYIFRIYINTVYKHILYHT